MFHLVVRKLKLLLCINISVVNYLVSFVLVTLAACSAVCMISLSTLLLSTALLELLVFSSVGRCCTTTTWTSGLLLPRDDAPAPITMI